MGTGVTAPSLLEQQIQEIMDQYAEGPAWAPNVLGMQEGINDTFTQAAADSYSSGFSAGDQVAVRAVAGSYARQANFTSLQTAVSAYQTLNAAHGYIAAIVNRLPRVIGGPSQRILGTLHRPIETLGKSIAQRAGQIARSYLRDHVQTTGWAANESGLFQRLIADSGLKPITSGPGIAPYSLEGTVSKLAADYNYLLTQVQKLGYALGHEQHSNAVPAQVWDQIHSLQGDVARIVRAQNALSLRLDAADNAIRVQNNQIAQLEGQLHGLRQVSTGWQDVKNALDGLARATNSALADVRANQARDHVHLEELLPLSLLMQPGMAGIKVLRQLEDTPCMCPQTPDVSGIPGELLALYEFITHG